jgi:hypothetical protein
MLLFSESDGPDWADGQIWFALQDRPKLSHRQTLIYHPQVKDWIQEYLCVNQHSDWQIDEDEFDLTAALFRQPLNWLTVLKFINKSIWDFSSVGSGEAAEDWDDLREKMLHEDWNFWEPRFHITLEVAAPLSEDPQPVC